MEPNFRTSLNIEDFNAFRLFEVVEEKKGETGRIFIIKRVKISENDTIHDTIQRIETIKKLLHEGRILQKTGRRKDGSFKYLGKGLDPKKTNIESIIIKKSVENSIIDVPVKDIASHIAGMTEQDFRAIQTESLSLLEKIMNALKEQFAKERQANPGAGMAPAEVSMAVAPKEKAKVSDSLKKQAPARTPKELQKEMVEEQEKANEDNRAKKRKETKLAKELDEKSDSRRWKDIQSNQKQEEIIKEDLKKR